MIFKALYIKLYCLDKKNNPNTVPIEKNLSLSGRTKLFIRHFAITTPSVMDPPNGRQSYQEV